MCLLVTIDGTKYLVDIGYGADAAMQPLPLVHGTEFTVLAPRRGRLEYRSIDMHTDKSQRLWVYSTRDSMDDDSVPWVEQTCFSADMEYFYNDYYQLSYYASTNPRSFFMPHLLVALAIVVDDETPGCEGDIRVAGFLTYFNEDIRRRSEGSMERVVLETVATETERITALERWFNIPLTASDRQSIHSTGLALAEKREQQVRWLVPEPERAVMAQAIV